MVAGVTEEEHDEHLAKFLDLACRAVIRFNSSKTH